MRTNLHEAARAEAAGDDGAWSQGVATTARRTRVAEVAALFEAQGQGLAALSNLFE
jgi:hypothetical protein